LNTGQLRLFQSVPGQQLFFLADGQLYMLGHQIMVGYVDDQIALLERFNRRWRHCGYQFVGTGRNGVLIYEYSRAKVLLAYVNTKVSHRLDTYTCLITKFHPQRAHVWELFKRFCGRIGLETHHFPLG
jgi:hypothetical protein